MCVCAGGQEMRAKKIGMDMNQEDGKKPDALDVIDGRTFLDEAVHKLCGGQMAEALPPISLQPPGGHQLPLHGSSCRGHRDGGRAAGRCRMDCTGVRHLKVWEARTSSSYILQNSEL